MWKPRPLMGAWTPDQQRVASHFAAPSGCRRLVVVSANGVGKSHLAADLGASFIADSPGGFLIVSAPTNRKVSLVLWPAIAERLRVLGLKGRGMGEQDWHGP